MRQGQVLAGRYEIGRRLGTGAQAWTCEATDMASGLTVVVKRLTLRNLKEWKPYDLFEREAKVLARLDHPRIPRLVDFFREEDPHDLYLYLVTTRAPGSSLAERMAAGWRPTEDEARGVARQVLEILVYLQGLRPPVIHRDIKPSNLIMNDAGQVYLVDFGAVQDAVRPQGGSTVVGTFGYMAPEQFAGRALPASDLYGLGATMAHLITRVPAAEIPVQGLRLDVGSVATDSPALVRWIDKMVAPVADKRPRNAVEALQDLDRVDLSEAIRSDEARRPFLRDEFLLQMESMRDRVTIRRTGGLLEVNIRPKMLHPAFALVTLMFTGGCAVVAGLVLKFAWVQPDSQTLVYLMSGLFGMLWMGVILAGLLAIMSLGLAVASMLRLTGWFLNLMYGGVVGAFSFASRLGREVFLVSRHTSIALSPQEFKVRHRFMWWQSARGKTEQIKAVDIRPVTGYEPEREIVITCGQHQFHMAAGLPLALQEGIARELRRHLQMLTGGLGTPESVPPTTLTVVQDRSAVASHAPEGIVW